MMLDTGAANVKSNPRMSADHESRDFDTILGGGKAVSMDFITLCEIAYPRMRKELRKAARKYGYRLVGCHKGSENVVAYDHSAGIRLKGHVTRFLSAGVRLLTPTRTATWCTFEVGHSTVNVAATHLVSGYENPHSSRLALRKALAKREVRRLSKKVTRAGKKGHLVVVGGDMNSQHLVRWASGLSQCTWAGFGVMGRMMQVSYVYDPKHWHVGDHAKGQISLNNLYTDHPVLIVRATVTPA